MHKCLLALVPIHCPGDEGFRCGEFKDFFALTLSLRGNEGKPAASVVFKVVDRFLFVETCTLEVYYGYITFFPTMGGGKSVCFLSGFISR